MFFSGDASASKRRVDMSGRGKERGKSGLIEDTRLQREMRQEQKRRNKAAVVIEKHFRRFVAVRKAKASVRREWEAKYSSVAGNREFESGSKVHQDPSFLSGLLFFFCPTNPSDRIFLSLAVEYLLAAPLSELPVPPDEHFGPAALSGAIRLSSLMSAVAVACLRSLREVTQANGCRHGSGRGRRRGRKGQASRALPPSGDLHRNEDPAQGPEQRGRGDISEDLMAVDSSGGEASSPAAALDSSSSLPLSPFLRFVAAVCSSPSCLPIAIPRLLQWDAFGVLRDLLLQKKSSSVDFHDAELAALALTKATWQPIVGSQLHATSQATSRQLELSPLKLLAMKIFWQRCPTFRKEQSWIWTAAVLSLSAAIEKDKSLTTIRNLVDGDDGYFSRKPPPVPAQSKDGDVRMADGEVYEDETADFIALVRNLAVVAADELERSDRAEGIAYQFAFVMERSLATILPIRGSAREGVLGRGERGEASDGDEEDGEEEGGGGGRGRRQQLRAVQQELAVVVNSRLVTCLVNSLTQDPLATQPKPQQAAPATAGAAASAFASLPQPATSASLSSRPSASSALVLCRFLHTATSALPHERSKLLAVLAFSCPFIRRLLPLILSASSTSAASSSALTSAAALGKGGSSYSSSSSSRSLVEEEGDRERPYSSSSSSSPSTSSSSDSTIVAGIVFCRVLSHSLIIIDDDEIHSHHRPLPPQDFAAIIAALAKLLWKLLWFSDERGTSAAAAGRAGGGGGRAGGGLFPSSSSSSLMFSSAFIGGGGGRGGSLSAEAASAAAAGQEAKYLVKVASTVMWQLYERNSRRQLAAPTTFHAPFAFDEAFVHQALSEGTKAEAVLRAAPFLVPFPTRVKVFAEIMEGHKIAARGSSSLHRSSLLPNSSRLHINVRRDRIVEDSFAQLNSVPTAVMQGLIRISYINEFGLQEAGVDGGGIFKDFIDSISRVAFNVQYGLFKETSDHLIYPNPASGLAVPQHLQYFEFLGKILGKALFEGILLDVPLAAFFLRKLCGRTNYLHDLSLLDPELHRNLLFLKTYRGSFESLGLFFSIESDGEFGPSVEVDLLPNGASLPVTADNVTRYVWLVANHRLNVQIAPQTAAFARGLHQFIPQNLLEMFNDNELQMLIGGSRDSVDLMDLERNTTYSGGYSETHPVIRQFWEVLHSWPLEDTQKFLKFVTGCSRGPLLGFSQLEPPFCIQQTVTTDSEGAATQRLPTSATCVNLLKLPPYEGRLQIEEKLLYAINSKAGFDLS